jgi:hypothetical protein
LTIATTNGWYTVSAKSIYVHGLKKNKLLFFPAFCSVEIE